MTLKFVDYTYDVAGAPRVIDGDTAVFKLSKPLDIGFHIVIAVSPYIRVRFARINCPEHGTPEGDAATAFTQDWLNAHEGTITVSTSHEDNYGRWVGEIVCTRDNANLSDALLASGHALPWPLPKPPGV